MTYIESEMIIKIMEKVFLFDLDSTITKEEILPRISKLIDKDKEMEMLTEKTMMGEMSFEESFGLRVDILKDLPIEDVSDIIANISLNEKLVKFLQEHKNNCYIVTGNLDVWINKLMKKIGMENNYFCSKANVKNNKLIGIEQIIKKEDVVSKFDEFCIAIGDGSNDRKLLEKSDIGIAFGGVRNVAPALLEICDYAFFDEDKLYCFLGTLIKE